jgi:hypothetical protein
VHFPDNRLIRGPSLKGDSKMKARLLISFLFFTLTSNAQRPDLTGQIETLASDIRQEVRFTTADRETLLEVRDQLQRSLEILQGGQSGGYSKDCFDFAYAKYYSNMNSTQATDKAIETCKQVVDMELLKFAFEKYYTNMNTTNALDSAVKAANRKMRGKIEILKFAFEKYYINMNTTRAMDKSVENTSLVGRAALTCIKDLYSRYYQNMNSTQALDKAFEQCR